jgi:hypothetical protein
VQRRTGRGDNLRGGLDEGKPGQHGLLGIVLVRSGIAEINEHAVAHVFCDEAVEAAHRLRDAFLVGGNNSAQVLRVHAGGERCRADEVREHHCDLAAVSCVLGPRLGDGGRPSIDRRISCEFPDGAQHLQPMPERNAEVLEVLIRQLRQNVRVDFAFAKCGLVLTKATASQPTPDVHRRIPTSIEP